MLRPERKTTDRSRSARRRAPTSCSSLPTIRVTEISASTATRSCARRISTGWREKASLFNPSTFHPSAPRRGASLLTGRYNYRTGVVDTYLGRSLMYPDEVTLAEMLATAGYRTGIFGKWHLGDNYPMRAIDQGFQEALTLNGGGIGQPSDPPGGESYFDPILFANGKPQKTTGLCERCDHRAQRLKFHRSRTAAGLSSPTSPSMRRTHRSRCRKSTIRPTGR